MLHSPPEEVDQDECNSLQVAISVFIGYDTKNDVYHLVTVLELPVQKLVEFWFSLLLSLLPLVLPSPLPFLLFSPPPFPFPSFRGQEKGLKL